MSDNYKDLVKEYKVINQNIRNQLVSLSLTVIVAIFVLADRKIGLCYIKWYLCAFILYVLTIAFNILSSISKSKHYELWLDGKIKNIDFRNSMWGKIAEILFWLPIVTFVIATSIFVASIILIIINFNIGP